MQVLWLAIIVPSKYPISGVPNFRQNATVFNALAMAASVCQEPLRLLEARFASDPFRSFSVRRLIVTGL